MFYNILIKSFKVTNVEPISSLRYLRLDLIPTAWLVGYSTFFIFMVLFVIFPGGVVNNTGAAAETLTGSVTGGTVFYSLANRLVPLTANEKSLTSKVYA